MITHLCRLWTITRTDGEVMGFTDHDTTITHDGLDHLPGSGMDAAGSDTRLGFATDNTALQGLITDARIAAHDIRTGLYSGAAITAHDHDWKTGETRTVMSGFIGEITTRGEDAFEIEIVGQTSRLETARGRVFSRGCDARFGDVRCGVDVSQHPPDATCARTPQACKAFGNFVNFRGFPYLIGDDATVAGASGPEPKDGGSRYA